MEKRFSWKLWLIDMVDFANDLDELMYFLEIGKSCVMELDGQPVDKLEEQGIAIADEWCFG